MTTGAFAAAVLAILALTGCLPIAWVNPPATVAVGATARAFVAEPAASPAPVDVGGPTQEPSRLTVRAAVQPLGFVEDLFERDYDVSIGYGLEPPLRRDAVHGPFVSVAWHPVHERISGFAFGRVAISGRTRLLWAGDAGNGFGLSMGISAEIVAFAAGSFADGDTSGELATFIGGAALGEGGIGIYAESGYGRLGPFAWVDVQVGLYLRVPMSAGFGIACCLLPS